VAYPPDPEHRKISQFEIIHDMRELRLLAERVAQINHDIVDIDAWARRLASDVANATD